MGILSMLGFGSPTPATSAVVDPITERVTYTSSAQDWRLHIGPGVFIIEPIATGGLEYSSGINLDNLAALIQTAKADAVARGIDWSGA